VTAESDSIDQGLGQVMVPLYRETFFTFRFADDRIIPRFHLEGVRPGQRVSVFDLDPDTGAQQALLATATAGEDGWVDVATPILVRAGHGFVAVPVVESERSDAMHTIN